MTYLGNTPTTQSFIEGTDYFNGDGSTVAFTLSRSVVSVNDIQATVNNVVQQPNTAYTVSGTTITFTSAPSSGSSNIYVRYLSTTTQSITPSQNTVSYSTLNSDTQSKLGISFKNRIINGSMVIDQRNAGASGTASGYNIDRWRYYADQASKGTWQQNAGSVTPPAGFTNYLGFTSSSAYTVGASEQFKFDQAIEGFNCADLGWGTINAKTVTLSFWVRSSLTGTFGGSLANGAFNRTYPFSYTISSANTWTQISITVAGDTTGTWLTTNGIGMYVTFGLGIGSTLSGTAGSWSSSVYVSATGATSVVGTNGATFYITGVQLEVGTQATTFDYRSIGTELALCQRYFETNYDYGSAVGSTQSSQLGGMYSVANSDGGGTGYLCIRHAVPKRTDPTVTGYKADGTLNTWVYYRSGVGNTNATVSFQNIGQASFVATIPTGANWTAYGMNSAYWTSSAEL